VWAILTFVVWGLWRRIGWREIGVEQLLAEKSNV